MKAKMLVKELQFFINAYGENLEVIVDKHSGKSIKRYEIDNVGHIVDQRKKVDVNGEEETAKDIHYIVLGLGYKI